MAPPPAPPSGIPTKWHPPGLQNGAMVYEANPNQNGDGNVGGEFYTATVAGTVGVTPLGTLIIILPTSDPLVLGALWNNAGTVTVSAGPLP